MIIIAADPGATTGAAVLAGDHITDLRAWRHMDKAGGRALFAAWLRTLSPHLIVVERPSNPGSGWTADGVEQLGERAGELVAMCEVLHPGVPILRPWPQPRRGGDGWQPWAHAGFVGEAKDRSLQCVQRYAAPGLVIPRAHDAWDAGAMACWARWGRSTSGGAS